MPACVINTHRLHSWEVLMIKNWILLSTYLVAQIADAQYMIGGWGSKRDGLNDARHACYLENKKIDPSDVFNPARFSKFPGHSVYSPRSSGGMAGYVIRDDYNERYLLGQTECNKAMKLVLKKNAEYVCFSDFGQLA